MNLYQEIKKRRQAGLYRERKPIDSAQGSVIIINNSEFINFGSNDYLGLANNDVLKECMKVAIDKYGIGAGSSQLITGHNYVHKKLEDKLASFLNRGAALVFPTGYQANLAVASVLIDKKTVVLQDKLNHASLIDAALLSGGRLFRYRHKDTKHLQQLLEKNKAMNIIVMTDGVFSMDGDFAPLAEIVDLCDTYGAYLLVDDAHGIGVLGNNGGGLLEVDKLNQKQVPILMGSFGKAFGAAGAFISGDKVVIDAFIQKARSYIYTTALLPALAATLNQVVDIVKAADDKRLNLKKLIKYYRRRCCENDLKQSVSDSHIQAYIVGIADKAVALSQYLYDKKIITAAIRPPTVASGTSRIRISLTAGHEQNQIDHLFESLKGWTHTC